MTLRQVWVRVKTILVQPDSPLVRSLQDAVEQSKAEQRKRALDDTEAMMRPKEG